MRINYNVTGSKRRSLVDAISQELNAPTHYFGAPTFAYEVGGYHINKSGTVTGPDNLELEADLQGLHGFEAVEREYDEPDTYENGLGGMGATPSMEDVRAEAQREMRRLKLESENIPDYSHRGQYGGDELPAFEELQMTEGEELGLGKQRREDFQGENGMRADDCSEAFTYQAELSDPNCNGLYDTFAIELPKNGLTDAEVQNLLKLVESKRTLLTKALGRPLTVNGKGETLQFLYPYSEEAGVGIMYSQLSTAFVNYAQKHQRVTGAEREVESEKFAMRTFLVRLGLNGADFRVARKWLCRNLSGNASFPSNASYAAMQASRRNGGQSDEQK